MFYETTHKRGFYQFSRNWSSSSPDKSALLDGIDFKQKITNDKIYANIASMASITDVISDDKQEAITKSVKALSSSIPIFENIIIDGDSIPLRKLNEYIMSTCCALAAIGCAEESIIIARIIDETGLNNGATENMLPDVLTVYLRTVVNHLLSGLSPFDVIVVDEMRLFSIENANLMLDDFDTEYAKTFNRLIKAEKEQYV